MAPQAPTEGSRTSHSPQWSSEAPLSVPSTPLNAPTQPGQPQQPMHYLAPSDATFDSIVASLMTPMPSDDDDASRQLLDWMSAVMMEQAPVSRKSGPGGGGSSGSGSGSGEGSGHVLPATNLQQRLRSLCTSEVQLEAVSRCESRLHASSVSRPLTRTHTKSSTLSSRSST